MLLRAGREEEADVGAGIDSRHSPADRTELRARRRPEGVFMGRGRVLAFAAALAVIVCGCFAAQAGAFVYWSDEGGGIGRANLDGTGVNNTFITATEMGADQAFGIAVDAQHIYWDDFGNNTIGRANLDGSGVNDGFITLTAGTGPEGVAVDGQHIYWGDSKAETIGRANLDGSGVNESFITLTSNSTPVAIAVDAQHIYWANFASDTIGRANLDGSDVNESFITDSQSARPSGVAVDGQHVYWSGSMPADTISRANLDGTGIQNIALNQIDPTGVAVDGQHVYWGNLEGGTIGRENLAGPTIPSSSFITGAGGPTGVAVDALPLAPLALITTPLSGATFAVGQVVDSNFACSEGAGGTGISTCLDQNGNGSGAAIDTTTPGPHLLTVTATSADGQTATASSPYTVLAPPVLAPPVFEPPAVAAPVLGGLKGSHARWRESTAPARNSSDKKRGRPPVGTTFTFTLNVPATVKLVFTTTGSGRLAKIKNKRACVAQTKHNTNLRKCTRTLTAGIVSLNAPSGTNKLVFQGRISPTRKLNPGTYTATFTATNPTGSSTPRPLKFTIVK
jgi:virginiamycin B lyase